MDNQLEGNKLIAEFMGWEHRDDIEINQLLYHTSWDWLMPVVEKISKEHLQHWDGTDCTDIIDTCYPITFNMPTEDGTVMFRFKGFSLHESDTLIDAAWEACVEFIQFHNDLKPGNKTLK